jgi:hypothetical protein
VSTQARAEGESSKMSVTKEAREVLRRCQYFAEKLREDPSGVAWEAQFSAALALLRSVGHVMDTTKTKQWWLNLRANREANAIFWKFINIERNLILKEAQLRAGQSVTVRIKGVSATGLAAGEVSAVPPERPPSDATSAHSYRMNDGEFVGRDDPRDLIDEAIAWWNVELSKIDGSTQG